MQRVTALYAGGKRLGRLWLGAGLLLLVTGYLGGCQPKEVDQEAGPLRALHAGFVNPPDSARPGVYWYFMDGNLSKEAMTKDLESMKAAGLGNLVFLEVNVGVPRGPVPFFGETWRNLFAHAVREAERLGIEITLGIGPGWTGSGGPWVAPRQSMQHLVASMVRVTGGDGKPVQLPVPRAKAPYFGEEVFTPALKKQWEDFYEDVAVLAFPTPPAGDQLGDADEKALYYRAPYTSVPGVKPFLPSAAGYEAGAAVPKDQIRDLSNRLRPDGTLDWQVPPGNWTLMRFGRRNNGAVTRPAPFPGLGFEADKMDTVALQAHLDAYVGKLLGPPAKRNARPAGGLRRLHLDSWEMGAQNWTARFREEFTRRRGYDPLPYYPVYAGMPVESREVSERFLWDLRQTAQELVLAYHARQVKKYAGQFGLGLSIEPYDMNPTADLELGSVADVPMGEFWSKGFGFPAAFSCTEAASIAHVKGLPVVAAEAFTADGSEAWKQYPGAMKNQGDWAFAAGINRLVFHTFQHQSLADTLRPGMTMGPYGVHWDRSQTWWPLVGGYHRYVSRCQFMLQQGRPVADVLYLTPEGAPHVFLPPPTATAGDAFMPDRRGYNFDGCSPGQLYAARVEKGQIVFPGGARYRLLVLPASPTMTPALLGKVRQLIRDGAAVVGAPPRQSPGLSGYPGCDGQVQTLATEVWGTLQVPRARTVRPYGKGKLVWGGELTRLDSCTLYPPYPLTARVLAEMGVTPDFESSAPLRYTHRTSPDWEVYFVANRSGEAVQTDCRFRTGGGAPELWNPLTAQTRRLPEYKTSGGTTTVPLRLEPYQSFFIVFPKNARPVKAGGKNFPAPVMLATLAGPWMVSFDPRWGGPGQVSFGHLTDWTANPQPGIKYYSGVAEYRQAFEFPAARALPKNQRLYLDLGEIRDMGSVQLNGKDLGVVWTAPRRVDITGVVREKNNQLVIGVANRWPNRLIGDAQLPDDGVRGGQWPAWLTDGEKRKGDRYTFTTYQPYTKDSPLLPSGLLGPVTIQQTSF